MVVKIKVGESEGDILEKQWHKNRATAQKRSRAVSGVKLAGELSRLYRLTDDPAFNTALLALKAYGLDRGEPERTARELQKRVFRSDEELNVFELMNASAHTALREKKRLNVRRAARRAVAVCGAEGPTFQTVVDKYRKLFNDLRGTDLFACPDPFSIGNTGRVLEVWRIDAHGDPESKTKQQVPDTLGWRRKAADGLVTVRYVAPPP